MKIGIIGADSWIGIHLVTTLSQYSHDLWILTANPENNDYFKPFSTHLMTGLAHENGPWIDQFPIDCDLIINAIWPLSANHIHSSNLDKLEQQMLNTVQNILYLASKKRVAKIIQFGNLEYYSARSDQALNENAMPDLDSKGFGKIFNHAIKLLVEQTDVSVTVLLSGIFLYCDDTIYPQLPTVFNKFAIQIDSGMNYIHLTHIDDLVGTTLHVINKKINYQIINVVDNKPILQKDLITLWSRKDALLGPVTIPSALAEQAIGRPLTQALAQNLTAKNDKLKNSGYWLKFPDYNSGFTIAKANHHIFNV